MDIQVILNQMIVLFILMALGFILGKAKVLTRDGNKMLSRLVLFVALPCTVLSSVFKNESDVTIGITLNFLLYVLLAYAIAFAVSVPVIYFTCRKKKNDRGMLNFMSVFGNSGFMGFPVVQAIFGVSAAYYVGLFNIPFNVLVFSLGIYLIARKSTPKEDQPEGVPDGEKTGGGFSPKFLLNPVLLAIFLTIPLAVTGVQPPALVADFLEITGSITTPGAMLVIGSTLAMVPLKTIFKEWQVIPVTLLKLLIIPLLTWLILSQILDDKLMLGVLVVLAGMPTAAMASMLAIEYNGNEQIASAGVFVTTLLCGVTVPLLVYWLLL
jgi:hypothetical protein